MPTDAIIIPIVMNCKAGLFCYLRWTHKILSIVRLTLRTPYRNRKRSFETRIQDQTNYTLPAINCPKKPVFDQGLVAQPLGVELVGEIDDPDPDQNHPNKFQLFYTNADSP